MEAPSCLCGQRCQLFGGGSSRLCGLCMRDLSRASMHWGCPCGAFVAGMECPCAPEGLEPRVMRREASMESLQSVEEEEDASDGDGERSRASSCGEAAASASVSGASALEPTVAEGHFPGECPECSDGSDSKLVGEHVEIIGVDAAGRSARLGEISVQRLCAALPKDRPRSAAAGRSAYSTLKDLLAELFLDDEQGSAERVTKETRHGKAQEWLRPCAAKVRPGMTLTVDIAGSVARCRGRSAL